jgi:hypothetical protein
MGRWDEAWSYTRVKLPERPLAEAVLDVAAPLLEREPTAPLERAQELLQLVVSFWNASVLASELWERRRMKSLNELRKAMRGRKASKEDAATFDLLTTRRKAHWLDPRLVVDWHYVEDSSGARRLNCVHGLPDGVIELQGPPADKRISIGGAFIDELTIRLTATSSLGFPYEQQRGVVADDGTVTVHAMMPAVVQLFAQGRLTRVGGAPVDVAVGGRAQGPMVLAQVGCAGERHDVAVLVFKPNGTTATQAS